MHHIAPPPTARTAFCSPCCSPPSRHCWSRSRRSATLPSAPRRRRPPSRASPAGSPRSRSASPSRTRRSPPPPRYFAIPPLSLARTRQRSEDLVTAVSSAPPRAARAFGAVGRPARTIWPMTAARLPTASSGADAPAPSPCPSDALFATLYAELHRLARREAARAGPNAVLSATTIIHEVYLDISQRDALVFPDRGHFLAYAARAMRAVVIDRARARGAQKRGGGLDITSLDTEVADSIAEPELLLS